MSPRVARAASSPAASSPGGSRFGAAPQRTASSAALRVGALPLVDWDDANFATTSLRREGARAYTASPDPPFGSQSDHVAIELQDVPEGEEVGLGDVGSSSAHSWHRSNSPGNDSSEFACFFSSTTVTTTRLPTSVSDILYRASRSCLAWSARD